MKKASQASNGRRDSAAKNNDQALLNWLQSMPTADFNGTVEVHIDGPIRLPVDLMFYVARLACRQKASIAACLRHALESEDGQAYLTEFTNAEAPIKGLFGSAARKKTA